MAGVPNRGAVGPFNPLNDNWNEDSTNAFFLSKLLYSAYKQVLAGATIAGPLYNINLALITDSNFQPDPIRFIKLYCPTLQDLLGTFPLVSIGRKPGIGRFRRRAQIAQQYFP